MNCPFQSLALILLEQTAAGIRPWVPFATFPFEYLNSLDVALVVEDMINISGEALTKYNSCK